MVSLSTAVTAAVMMGLAPLASAQSALFSAEEGVSFRVNIPPSTASSADGPIYLQMQAPSDMEWVGIGQGEQMEGANMFVMYASSPTNVTLSPRLGTGHSMPDFNPDTQVALIEGSGIENGVMTAIFRCDNCLSWSGGGMDPKDPASQWIWAGSRGEPMNSADLEAPISFHGDSMGGFTFDLTQATGGSSSNPFATVSEDEQQGGTGSESSGPHGPWGSPLDKMRSAHGIIMSFVFVIFFPAFALTLFLFPSSKVVSRIHAPLQLTALALGIAGFGVGVAMAREMESATGYHAIIGYVVMAYFIAFQPALGLLHHLHFKKTGTKSLLGYSHRWFGRLFLVMGIINGGWGFQYAGIGTKGVPTAGIIAYGVISGVMGVIYIGVVILDTLKKSKQTKDSPSTSEQGDVQNVNTEAKTNASSSL
ncbi:hypothetical protein FQN54_008874 [Arachnomyces sp. PD_36]|nr:hypothetical protein FQN54_008874 [Arachnomyces sp. PD_36]